MPYLMNAAEAIEMAKGAVNFQNNIPFKVGEILTFEVVKNDSGEISYTTNEITTADGRKFNLFMIDIRVETEGQKWTGGAGIGVSEGELQKIFDSGVGICTVQEVGKNKTKTVSIIEAGESEKTQETTVEAEVETK